MSGSHASGVSDPECMWPKTLMSSHGTGSKYITPVTSTRMAHVKQITCYTR